MKFLFVFCLASSLALAENSSSILRPEVRLSGEVDFFFELAQMPSSEQGQTRFDFALVQLSPEVFIEENLALLFRFVLTEERSATEENYLNQLQNAYIRYQDPKFAQWIHEVGLIRNAWISTEKESQELDFFGDSGRSLARRYSVLAEGDLGYQARYRQNDKMDWALGFANGEENRESETGASKETFLGFFFKENEYVFQLWLSAGRVDRVDHKINDRNRAFLRIQKQSGRLFFGLEGFASQDPSVEVESEGRFEGITFTELLQPEEIQTYGGRLDLAYQLSDSQKIALRFDLVTPHSSRKKIESAELAWIKRESKAMVWGLFLEKTELGTQHSAQSKLRERARLGVEVAF